MNEYGGEFCSYSLDDRPSTDNPCDPSVFFLRSGRDALRFIAYLLKNATGRIWLPCYSCQSMVKPFLDAGMAVRFYPIGFLPEENYETITGSASPGDAVLYLHYFGHCFLTDAQLAELSKLYRLIEDRTQNLFDTKPGGFVPEYSAASLRKWFSLFDGGYVRVNDACRPDCISAADTVYAGMRQTAFDLKSEFHRTQDPDMKTRARGLLAKAEEWLNGRSDICAMSDGARRLLNAVDIKSLAQARRDNYNRLYLLLSEAGGCGLIGLEDANSVPLYFILLVGDRAELQTGLASDGVYCPHLWPLPEQAAGICAKSQYASDHVLCVPCDQRYGASDMDCIARCLIKRLPSR